MKRGPYKRHDEQYAKARELRAQGLGYKSIASQIEGVQWSTIARWVSDIKFDRNITYRKWALSRRKDVVELRNGTAVRKRIIEERGEKCEQCGISEWMGQSLTIELHHVDGNDKNNDPDNLELLCPNCHSQTSTYRNKYHRASVVKLVNATAPEAVA